MSTNPDMEGRPAQKWKRISRWFWCNLVFALTPLGLMLLIRFLGQKLNFQDIASSPEILFFSLILCATSLGDALEYRNPANRDTLFTNIAFALIFIGLISAVLYGCLLFDTVLELQQISFRTRLLMFSIPLALSSLLVSYYTQTMIGKIEGTA